MSITVAATGASGLQYTFKLMECLFEAGVQVNLVFSAAAYMVAEMELGIKLPGNPKKLQAYLESRYHLTNNLLKVYHNADWSAEIASGTTTSTALVVCPCTSGSLASIAHGLSDNLIERAADVVLKERKKLILVHRETPLSSIHLKNALALTEQGAIYLPANPGFYHHPDSLNDIIDFIVARILDHLEITHHLIQRWGHPNEHSTLQKHQS